VLQHSNAACLLELWLIIGRGNHLLLLVPLLLQQGDVADGCEAAIVALPASDDLSPASSEGLDDVEEGRLEVGQTSACRLLLPCLD
jgi:hypothetical protein